MANPMVTDQDSQAPTAPVDEPPVVVEDPPPPAEEPAQDPPAENPPAEAPDVQAPPASDGPPTDEPAPAAEVPADDTPIPVEGGSVLDAADDTAQAAPGSVTLIPVSALLANDILPTGGASVVGVGDASHGTVQLDQDDGVVVFDAEDGFVGPAGFSYTITDSSGSQDTARVEIAITGEVGTGRPTAVDDTVTTEANQQVVMTASALLENDQSPGPQIVLSGVSNAAHGTVSLDQATGNVTFVPDENFVGEAGFDYLATADGTDDTGHVTVTVTAPAPDAVDDTAIIQGNRTVTIGADLLLANDRVLPGSDPRIVSVGSPEHGSVGLDRAGDVVFAPERGFVGDARFAYTVADDFGGRDTASVAVRVIEAPPDAPAQPPVVNITQTATITQIAIINNIIQNLPPTPSVPASPDGGGGDGGGAAQGLEGPVQAYFVGTSSRHGTELWGTDGSRVAELADISQGGPSSAPADMSAVGGRLLFSASDLAHGREPWIFDGVAARQLADVNPGDGGSDPTGFTLAGRTLYFTADDGAHGRELWSAQAGSVTMVADLAAGPQGAEPQHLAAFDGDLFFAADDDVRGAELWRVTDGQDPERVADLAPGLASSAPDALTVADGSLFFVADDGIHGRELFELRDGEGQPVLHDLTPGAGSTFGASGRGEPLAEIGGKLFAVAGDGVWADGPGGFERVADLGQGRAGETAVVDGRLYAAMSDGLARFDPETGNVTVQSGIQASDLTAVGDTLYFTTGAAERMLWRDDGTGARQVNLAGEAQPHDLAPADGGLAFSAGGRLGLADDGAVRFLTAESGQDYVPVNVTPANPDALMLL